MSQLLEISDKSYYVWKKKTHTKLIKLIENTFSEKDLEEFLETGKITRLELLSNMEEENFYANTQYLHIFLDQDKSSRFSKSSDYGYDFYFSILVKIKNMLGNEQIPFFDVYEFAWSALYQTVLDPENFKPNEQIPVFSDFGCGANKALQMNLHSNFSAMINIARENRFNAEEKREAYIHALTFNLYSIYPEQSFIEKKHILKSLLYSLFPKEIKENENGVFLNPFIEINIDLIEKNYDMIIESLRAKKVTDA